MKKPTFFNKNENPCLTHHKRQPMDVFAAAAMRAASSGPNPLTGIQRSAIERRLADFFTDFRIPDHPPYAAMIHLAIQELNEKGGSSEDAISIFIRSKYDNLPWAHSTLLKHHLGKLCDCGEITVTCDQHYLLAGASPNLSSSSRPSREKPRKKQRWELRTEKSKQRKKGTTRLQSKQKDAQMKLGAQPVEMTEIEAVKKCNEVVETREQENSFIDGQIHLQKHESGAIAELNQSLEEQIQPLQRNEVVQEEQQTELIENLNLLEWRQNGTYAEENQQEEQQIGMTDEQKSRLDDQQIDVIMEQNHSAGQHRNVRKRLHSGGEENAGCSYHCDPNMEVEQLEKETEAEIASPESPPGFDLKEPFVLQQQAVQKKPSNERLRVLSFKRKPATAASTADLLPSQRQHEEQQQPECQGQGCSHKLIPDTAVAELVLSDHQKQGEQVKRAWKKPLHMRLRPRLSKSEPATAASVKDLVPSQQQQQQQEVAEKEPPSMRLRRWPPKPESENAASTADLLSSHHQHEQQQLEEEDDVAEKEPPCRRSRPWPSMPEPANAASTVDLLPSQHNHEHQQQPECQNHDELMNPAQRVRGRPPKIKTGTATTEDVSVSSNTSHDPQREQQQEEQLKHRGRPRKPEGAKKQQQKLKRETRGRPRKIKNN